VFILSEHLLFLFALAAFMFMFPHAISGLLAAVDLRLSDKRLHVRTG